MNKNAIKDSFTYSGRARTKKLVKYDILYQVEKDRAVDRKVILMEHERI